jgi:hypothetical protein
MAVCSQRWNKIRCLSQSYSQPSAKRVILFAETGDSLGVAFFKRIVFCMGPPTMSVSDPVTRSCKPALAEVVCLFASPRTRKVNEQCGRF